MIGYYNYTVILTYIGTVFGFVGLTYIGSGNLKMSLLCLMIAGFCDMFDGKIASTMKRTKQEKRFGIQIDSLSDLICFGVLPAAIGLYCAGKSHLHIAISAVFMLCALIRLAWFNVDEEERQNTESSCRKIYLGLPVTSTAILIPFFAGISNIFNLPMHLFFSWVLLTIGIAFLMPFKLKKPCSLGKILLSLAGLSVFIMVIIGLSV